jgi:hypothetical protein
LALKTEPGAAGALVALADRIELWPIDRLRPYERNPRTHSEAQVDQIAASMIEFGWTNPVLVDENSGILAGHGRLLAAHKLGLAEVPVIRFEHLSEAQKRAYLIADNQLALQAGWSEELLAQELAWLRDESFDLDLVGFGWGFSTNQDFNGDIALIACFAASWTPAMVRRWHADPFGFLRPWNEVPALMGSAPPATPPSTGTGVITFLMG